MCKTVQINTSSGECEEIYMAFYKCHCGYSSNFRDSAFCGGCGKKIIWIDDVHIRRHESDGEARFAKQKRMEDRKRLVSISGLIKAGRSKRDILTALRSRLNNKKLP